MTVRKFLLDLIFEFVEIATLGKVFPWEYVAN